MTDKELDTYNFIVSYIEDNGYPPTVREIMEGVGVVIHSNYMLQIIET